LTIWAHPQAHRRKSLGDSAKLVVVNLRLLFRFVLPALISVPLGFILLALAAQNEPSIPTPVVFLFSPGLKFAEMLAPETHQSLGATFGTFLRIAIGVNAAYYFILFAAFSAVFSRARKAPAHGRA
jgi:hypothetical protein